MREVGPRRKGCSSGPGFAGTYRKTGTGPECRRRIGNSLLWVMMEVGGCAELRGSRGALSRMTPQVAAHRPTEVNRRRAKTRAFRTSV